VSIAFIISSILINSIDSSTFGPSANTSPTCLPDSDCLEIILAAISLADNPGLSCEPTIINGGGSGLIGSCGILKAANIVFKTPLIVPKSNVLLLSAITLIL